MKKLSFNFIGSSDFHVGKNLTFVLFRHKMGFPIRVVSLNWLALDRNWHRFSKIYIIPVKLSNKNPYKSAKNHNIFCGIFPGWTLMCYIIHFHIAEIWLGLCIPIYREKSTNSDCVEPVNAFFYHIAIVDLFDLYLPGSFLKFTLPV